MKFHIVYDRPGRLRVRCGPGAFTQEQGYGIAALLLARPGVTEVTTCPVNGSVLVLYRAMPKDSRARVGAKNSCARGLAQYGEDIRRDYVTGVYNSRFIHEEYRSYAEKQASRGIPVGAVLLRVNEYWELRNRESREAAECCLNSAAGILQLAVGTDQEHAVLARLEEGLFAAVTVGMPAARLAEAINKALEGARRVFSISLSRRGTFTVSVASAEWAETSSWEMMLSLAQQRL